MPVLTCTAGSHTGTNYGYQKRGCRCDDCKAANAEYNRQYKHRALSRKPEHRGRPTRFDAELMRHDIIRSGLTVADIERHLGYSCNSLHYAMSRGGMYEYRLDEIACFLGRHMSEYEVAS